MFVYDKGLVSTKKGGIMKNLRTNVGSFAAIAIVLAMLLAGCPNEGNDDNNQTPVAADFDITGSFTQTLGSVTGVKVAPRSGKSTGNVTVYYSGSRWLPDEIGSYEVTFNVAAGPGWDAAKGLSAGTLTIGLVDMVSIPGGTFIMGSPWNEPDRSEAIYSDPEMQHPVTLSGFSIGKYQVTQAQYQAVMGAGADVSQVRYGKGDKYPIYFVNWYYAIVFCNKLSMMEGLDPVYSIGGETDPAKWGAVPQIKNDTWDAVVVDMSKNGYRLPTEAEWEYACRGSYRNKATEYNTKPFGVGDRTKMVSGMASFNVTKPYDLAQWGEYTDYEAVWNEGMTTEVGSYPANNYGLHDMHGNVFEWCWDWYGDYTDEAQTNPLGAATGPSGRVQRGGNRNSPGRHLRSAYRSSCTPENRNADTGFRLARSL
jgi:formylglycine-generating enzyme required for sulfatase activity